MGCPEAVRAVDEKMSVDDQNSSILLRFAVPIGIALPTIYELLECERVFIRN